VLLNSNRVVVEDLSGCLDTVTTGEMADEIAAARDAVDAFRNGFLPLLVRSGTIQLEGGGAPTPTQTELVAVSRLAASTPAGGKGGVQPSGYRWK